MKTILILGAVLLALSSCKKEEVIVQNVTVDTTIVQTEYNAEFTIADLEPVSDTYMPIFLREGDKVAVCAASNSCEDADIRSGINTLQSWGLEVIEADNILLSDGRYAGTLQQRIEAFQDIVDNQEIRAIFMTRGGYGAAQILPFIKWDALKESPKWLIGYSDVTAIHIALNNQGYATIHGPMMREFNKDQASIDALKAMLFGEQADITIATNSNCVKGTATGRIVGGNLSLINAMSGTAFDLNTLQSILFIEDTGESNYSIDRMLLNLQQSGKLQHIKGLIVGDFIDNSQGVDLPLNEIIQKYTSKLNIPVVYGVHSGHGTVNIPIMLGQEATISIDDTNASITFNRGTAAK